MAIDSKNILVLVKAMSRAQALPLDESEVHDSLASAQLYASSPTAYAGQTIKAMLDDGKYHQYILQPSDAGYVLEEVGGLKDTALKQYVMVVDELPEYGQVEGVLYINGTDGYVWTGSDWRKVFSDVSSAIDDAIEDANERFENIESELENKAPVANPVFTGTVKVGDDEVAMKSYVEGLFANLVSAEPGIVDSAHPLPSDYKAGQHFRVAEDGTYAGVDCEVGDLILVVKNYAADTASNDDFMVLQANVDGAVTSASDVSTVGEIVVFDSVTGKVIKGSGVQIASLNEAVAKMHEHGNNAILDSYNKTQAELLAAAKAEAESLVGVLEGSVNDKLANVATKGTTLAEYGITDAYTKTEADALHKQITDNLNSKISAAEVDDKIATAKEEILEEAATAAETNLNAKIGDIGESETVVAYIDRAVGNGGVNVADKIDECLDTAKAYTDEQIAAALAIVEF